jgi:prepilin-type N-terminal cleavage/methylation domain-containing protein/prepilin-type processing-associated H-X9-DG protein
MGRKKGHEGKRARERTGTIRSDLQKRLGPRQRPHSNSEAVNSAAFTLIELLVVIAVIALLMATLLPVLGRTRRQAKALACQSKLRQWGIDLYAYVAEYDGRLPFSMYQGEDYLGVLGAMWNRELQHGKGCTDMLLCPMATRPPKDAWGQFSREGATFRAWREQLVVGQIWMNGSYGWNMCVGTRPGGIWPSEPACWTTVDVRQAPRIPVFFDCTAVMFFPGANPAADPSLGPPPQCEDSEDRSTASRCVCINRHDGGINMCFLDSSVRKVGLKELWTFKWARWYNTANRWTKAGSVQPEDWPKWMRRFKDY